MSKHNIVLQDSHGESYVVNDADAHELPHSQVIIEENSSEGVTKEKSNRNYLKWGLVICAIYLSKNISSVTNPNTLDTNCSNNYYTSIPSNGLAYSCQKDAVGNFNGLEKKQLLSSVHKTCPQYEYVQSVLCNCDSQYSIPQVLNNNNQLISDSKACQLNSTTGLWTGQIVWTNKNPSNNICPPKTTPDLICTCTNSSYDLNQPLMCQNNQQVLQPLSDYKCPAKTVANPLCDSTNINNYIPFITNGSACNYDLGQLVYTWKTPSNLVNPNSYPNKTFPDTSSPGNSLCKCNTMCDKGRTSNLCTRDGYVHWTNKTGTSSTITCPDICKNAETPSDTGLCNCDNSNGHPQICLSGTQSIKFYTPTSLNQSTEYCYKPINSTGICQSSTNPLTSTDPLNVNYCSAYQNSVIRIDSNSPSEICFPNSLTLAAKSGTYEIFTGNTNFPVPNTTVDTTGNLILNSYNFTPFPVSTSSSSTYFYLTTIYRSNPQIMFKYIGNANGPYVLSDTSTLTSTSSYKGKWWTPVDEPYISGVQTKTNLKNYQLWKYDGVNLINKGTGNTLTSIIPVTANYTGITYLIQPDTNYSNPSGSIYVTSNSLQSEKIVDNGFNQSTEISVQLTSVSNTTYAPTQFYFIIPKTLT
jgi:hypothetical protein